MVVKLVPRLVSHLLFGDNVAQDSLIHAACVTASSCLGTIPRWEPSRAGLRRFRQMAVASVPLPRPKLVLQVPTPELVLQVPRSV